MAQAAVASQGIELRCHHCSHSVGTSAVAMRMVAMFKRSLLERIPAARERAVRLHEVRRLCEHCGWINIFHPLTERGEWRTVEVK